MRVMMIVKANAESEAGAPPTDEIMSEMAAYNSELQKAGVLLDATGLKPSSKGARVRIQGDKRTVIDGPFAETKELIAGYWILQVSSWEEALEWAKRAPNPHPGQVSEIEVRPYFELDDFAPSEGLERHREIAKELAKQK